MFVTFEGPEGGGKSTVLREISARLEQRGIEHVLTREPGSGTLGKEIRRLLLEEEHVEPRAELFLFLADRAQHVANLVRPTLTAGQWVLCDRYADSTVVYQGHARGFGLDHLRQLNNFATQGLQPDLTLLFDLDPAVGLSRRGDLDRLDQEPLEFHQRVREGFLIEAKREPQRWAIIDAQSPLSDVIDACWALISARAHL